MARGIGGRFAWHRRLVANPALQEFFRFGLVGAAGFVCNVLVVYILRAATNLYVAGIAAYAFAATVTWLLNRLWTFSAGSRKPMVRQWILYLASNAVGFAIYYAAYALAISYVSACRHSPILAVALGAALSMLVNFSASQRIVFR